MGSLLRLKPASAGTDSAQAEIAGLGRPPETPALKAVVIHSLDIWNPD